MGAPIHVPLSSLLPGAAASAKENPLGSPGRTFYIETFGCQMNDHDSEKVAGVLLRRGYRQVASPDDASLVFYNTCSIREKAAQKVFSRLGEFNPKNNWGVDSGKVIGVLGCVAQQEGKEIFERAPWVSLVCGSASYRKLPLLLARLEAGERRVSGLGNGHGRDFRDGIDAARSSFSRLSDDHRGLRQGLLVLRGAVHAWAGAQPRQRFHPAGSCASLPTSAIRRCNCSGRPSTPIAIHRLGI